MLQESPKGVVTGRGAVVVVVVGFADSNLVEVNNREGPAKAPQGTTLNEIQQIPPIEPIAGSIASVRTPLHTKRGTERKPLSGRYSRDLILDLLKLHDHNQICL